MNKKIAIVVVQTKNNKPITFYVSQVGGIQISRLISIIGSSMVEHLQNEKINQLQWSIIDTELEKMESDTLIDFENQTITHTSPFVEDAFIEKVWKLVKGEKYE